MSTKCFMISQRKNVHTLFSPVRGTRPAFLFWFTCLCFSPHQEAQLLGLGSVSCVPFSKEEALRSAPQETDGTAHPSSRARGPYREQESSTSTERCLSQAQPEWGVWDRTPRPSGQGRRWGNRVGDREATVPSWLNDYTGRNGDPQIHIYSEPESATLFGNGASVDAVKMGSYDTGLGPRPSERCPCKEGTPRRYREDGRVTTEQRPW